MPRRASRIHSYEDARHLAKRRLPRIVFDFVDGAAGREIAAARNEAAFDEILLQPRVMEDVSDRSLATPLFNRSWGVPFGIAPMGMCDLVCPGADRLLAKAATAFDFPVCLSSAASSSIEDMAGWAGDRAWFQLYFGRSPEASLATAERARNAGYDTLILTVDVPQVSRRPRDLRNGFNMPFTMTPRAFWDFATHPRWSISTLFAGVPQPRNFGDGGTGATFDRRASRAGADWEFLDRLRDNWPGKLVVKGVTSAADAMRVRKAGADGVYVSNHGGRQLDSAPPAIQLLPVIRRAVGPDYPILFDSGIRNGEDIVKALALGADFVMLGRPALFALGAEGGTGLNALLTSLAEDIGIAMAQLGVRGVPELGSPSVFTAENAGRDRPEPPRPAALHIANKT